MVAWVRRLGLAGVVLLGVMALGMGAGPSEAQGGNKLDARGMPKGFKAGESVRYAIWHGKKGWHVRTTTATKEHEFKGHIRVEGGTFESVASHDLEATGKLV